MKKSRSDNTQYPTYKGVPPRALFMFVFFYVKNHAVVLFLFFLIGAISAVIDISMPVILGKIIGIIHESSIISDREFIINNHKDVFFASIIIVIIVRPVAGIVQNILNNQYITPMLMHRVRWSSHINVSGQKINFFDDNLVGKTVSRVIQIGPAVRETIICTINSIWHIIFYEICALLMAASLKWQFCIPLLGWFLSYSVILYYFIPKLKEQSRNTSEIKSYLHGVLSDYYTNIHLIKSFCNKITEDKNVMSFLVAYTKNFKKQLCISTKFSITLSLLNCIFLVTVGIISIFQWENNIIDAAIVATMFPIAWQLTTHAAWINQNVTSIFESIGVIQDAIPTLTNSDLAATAELPCLSRQCDGEIVFSNIYFRYKNNTEMVLNDINFNIGSGEKVGIIGPSGSGKSTIIKLLLRYYSPISGSVFLSGADLSNANVNEILNKISVVSQDLHLLHRSVRDNICFGSQYVSENDMYNAAEKSKSLDFILKLEDTSGRHGFDAYIGDGGVQLSRGERQRIAIARALVHNSPILLLDEATSSIDINFEYDINNYLFREIKNKTMLVISHRLSCVNFLDRIILINNGRIIENGTHTELLDKNEWYANLWKKHIGAI